QFPNPSIPPRASPFTPPAFSQTPTLIPLTPQTAFPLPIQSLRLHLSFAFVWATSRQPQPATSHFPSPAQPLIRSFSHSNPSACIFSPLTERPADDRSSRLLTSALTRSFFRTWKTSLTTQVKEYRLGQVVNKSKDTLGTRKAAGEYTMGAVCCCLHFEDYEDYVNPNSSVYRNCMCLSCFLQYFLHVYGQLFRRGEVHSVSSSIQGAASLNSPTSLDSSLADMYRSPPRPLPYDADPRYFRLQRDGLVSRREKGSSHSHEEAEPLRSDNDDDTEFYSTGDKWNASTCEEGSKEQRPRSSLKLSSAKATSGIGYIYSSSEDEEVCPTCLEEYAPENPKIMTKCSHHFHLGCIYEWMERSDSCPVCGKVMAFDETT
ncbi:unnamed protein product, partial [Linum tenue]